MTNRDDQSVDVPEASQRTPLYAWHVAAGAKMIPFGGWEMPVQYTSILEEHHATRGAAGLFDTCHMGEIRLTGRGAAATLDRLLTRPVSSLAVGRGRYALLCAEDGTVLDDSVTFRLGDDDFWLVVNAGTRADDLAWIGRHAGDCEIVDESSQTGKLDVQGPKALEILTTLSGEGDRIAALRHFSIAEMTLDGIQARVARCGYTGEDGFEIFCAAEHAVPLCDALMAVGAGLKPCGLGARDTLRLEACLPLYGHEFSRERPAHAAGMAWAIDMTSDFIGRGALLEASAVTLVPFLLDGRRAARQGDAIFGAPTGGDRIGVVTSGSFCPTLGAAAGLAYVDRATAGVGTGLYVESRGKRIAAKIKKKPLYKRGGAA